MSSCVRAVRVHIPARHVRRFYVVYSVGTEARVVAVRIHRREFHSEVEGVINCSVFKVFRVRLDVRSVRKPTLRIVGVYLIRYLPGTGSDTRSRHCRIHHCRQSPEEIGHCSDTALMFQAPLYRCTPPCIAIPSKVLSYFRTFVLKIKYLSTFVRVRYHKKDSSSEHARDERERFNERAS